MKNTQVREEHNLNQKRKLLHSRLKRFFHTTTDFFYQGNPDQQEAARHTGDILAHALSQAGAMDEELFKALERVIKAPGNE